MTPTYSAEVKNEWSYTSTSPYIFVTWCLIKQVTAFRNAVFLWGLRVFWK